MSTSAGPRPTGTLSPPATTVRGACVAPCSHTGLALASLLLLAGCSVNGTGLVAAQVIDADGAQLVDAYSVGAIVRTSEAPGLTVGLRRRVTIHPRGAGPLRAGWHYLRVPHSGAAAIATDTRAVGLDITLGAPRAGLTLGYAAETVLAKVEADVATDLSLRYRSDAPENTVLDLCQGRPSCPEP